MGLYVDRGFYGISLDRVEECFKRNMRAREAHRFGGMHMFDLKGALSIMSSELLLKWSEETSVTYGEDGVTATEVRYIVAKELERRSGTVEAVPAPTPQQTIPLRTQAQVKEAVKALSPALTVRYNSEYKEWRVSI